MRLQSFRVRKFRNVVDSGEVTTPDSVTCLVGKNEAGKSGLLEALYLLNPAYQDKPEVDKQYPRWLLVKDRRDGSLDEVSFISANFVLEDDDMRAVEEKYGACLQSNDIKVSRTYGGQKLWSVRIDEAAIVKHLRGSLSKDVQREVGKPTTLAELAATIEALTVESTTEVDASEIAQAKEMVAEHNLKKNDAFNLVHHILKDRLPTFFRFTGYQTLPGRIDIKEIAAATEENPGNSPIQTARALIQLAGTTAEQLSEDDYELRRGELEAVSIDLTNQVFEYWKQNPDLEVIIDIDKEENHKRDGIHVAVRYLDVRLRDKRTGYSNNFSQRSSGFQWFFSFLAAFSEFEDKESTIVLLDEPALALHGKAQADFLRFINERLALASPVIYTTHSPFMVEMGHLERVRIVEDRGPPLGSVVSADALANDPDSLFPLQAALGYDIAQSLFIGPNNLVVEGTSDFIYLTTMSRIAAAKSLSALDPRWRILPSGGATNIPTFVSLVGPHLDITVLADSDTQGMQRVTNMIDKKLLVGTRLILANSITGAKHADIEDLFSEADYLNLFNETFKTKLKATDLGPGDRITKRIEAKQGSSFDHGAVAETMLRTHQTLTLSPESIENFSKLNQAINATIRN